MKAKLKLGKGGLAFSKKKETKANFILAETIAEMIIQKKLTTKEQMREEIEKLLDMVLRSVALNLEVIDELKQ